MPGLPSRFAFIILISILLTCGASGQSTTYPGPGAGPGARAGAGDDSRSASQPPPTTQPTTQPATQPTPNPNSRPSAAQVQQQMLGLMSENPNFDATKPASGFSVPTTPPTAISADVDTKVLGIPPGGDQSTLRREGEFLVNRRGRLVRSSGGGGVLFVFDAESDSAAEPPMPLLPCQILENMESLSMQQNNRIAFIVSGQVMLYRGINFLLPTMMKLSIDRGNLQP